MAYKPAVQFDERLYKMGEDVADAEGYALMGLLGINVLGMSYRKALDLGAKVDPAGHDESVYDVEYQMENGKWAKFAFETIEFHEQVPAQIINYVKCLRELQREYLKELEK